MFDANIWSIRLRKKRGIHIVDSSRVYCELAVNRCWLTTVVPAVVAVMLC